MVALPTDPTVDTMFDGSPLDGELFVNRAARIELATISPRATDGSTSEGSNVMQALKDAGLPVDQTFADRYNYAAEASRVSWKDSDIGVQWQPSDFARHSGRRIQLTLSYTFQLTVPLANGLLATSNTIAGVKGYFLPLTSTYTVQLSPGREAESNQNGYPVQPVAP